MLGKEQQPVLTSSLEDVLMAVAEHQPAESMGIMAVTGLKRTNTYRILGRLSEAGLIITQRDEVRGPHRPKELYSLNPDAAAGLMRHYEAKRARIEKMLTILGSM